jgi:hypothetical protein
MIKGHTRVLGRKQGYVGLPVRDEKMIDGATGLETPCMVTAWEPTPAELADLAAGAPVVICILGSAHPPIIVATGEIPA